MIRSGTLHFFFFSKKKELRLSLSAKLGEGEAEMPSSVFATCSDGCGWTGAIVASLSFGSFGVPIKTSVHVEVDPLVMQSYKTMVCFVTCWLVLFMGETVRWTPWGIVSGIFWVPAATCGIYGIRNAGLAVAVGTWSSIVVVTSFFWGIIVFQESIRTFHGTSGAFLLLVSGLIGMSHYSKPPPRQAKVTTVEDSESDSEQSVDSALKVASKRKSLKTKVEESLEMERLIVDESDSTNKTPWHKDRIVICRGRVALTRRQLGLVGAVINGTWGGANLIPLHFASQQGFGGAGYLISYATGSMIVQMFVWMAYLAYYVHEKNGAVREALDCLPSFHWKELGYPGLIAGLLYSLGNFGSIMAVTYLGQGVGSSFCQSSMLVSGLWGIFYFGEISGREAISKWFLSACVTIVGIIWLSYEHQGGAVH